MNHLLNLLAAIALLIWGAHIVRTGVLRVLGGALREILARGIRNRLTATLAGIGVTALLQSGTATALIVSSFVAQGLVALPLALALMLGADVGTSLVAVAFSFDLSWLAPLFILCGVIIFTSRQGTTAGRVGNILIGLGLMLLALRLISASTNLLSHSAVVDAALAGLAQDSMLALVVGAVLVVCAYSSLAIVLLIASLAASATVLPETALALVLGANVGSGLLAVFSTARASAAARRVPAGNLIFKLLGVLLALPLTGAWLQFVEPHVAEPHAQVVLFHLAFNALLAVTLLGITHLVAAWVERLLPEPQEKAVNERLNHLDVSALSTPSVAMSCAAREALHQADVTETMLRGVLTVIRTDDLALAKQLREMDDTVDALYSSIKYYLAKIPYKELSEAESRRWTDIISFTINLEQVGDIIERILVDIEEKKIAPGRAFSEAGMNEICEMHARLLDNLRLAMSVFLNGTLNDAQRLIEEKVRFRELERQYAARHLGRLARNTVTSIETSSLHLDLISDLRRINSLVCSVAYPILESAGALAPSRLRGEAQAQREARRKELTLEHDRLASGAPGQLP